MRQATSKRPYLIRAMHEWMTDNSLTPHVVIDASARDLKVPEHFIDDGRIVLNISYSATRKLSLGDEALSFDARFGGDAHHIEVPVRAVAGIYAQETGQGMIFSEDETSPPGSDQPRDDGPSGRPALKIVK